MRQWNLKERAHAILDYAIVSCFVAIALVLAMGYLYG